MVDEIKTNPNLFELNKYFDNINSRYFEAGIPNLKYFENVNCYNCGSSEISNEFTFKNFRHVHCKKCGMIYVNPRLKEAIVHGRNNETIYDKFYDIKIIPSIGYRRNVLGLNKYKQVALHFSEPQRVLDIGCGVGEVLSVFKEHKWDCLGIEFNEHASKYAREEFGLEIINKSVYDFKDNMKFEVILMFGILEHLHAPAKILRKIHKLLTKDGILVIEVPSADSLLVRSVENGCLTKVDRIIEGDRHLMLFSVRGFKSMVESAGFKTSQLISNGLDISTINRNFLLNKIGQTEIDYLQELIDKNLEGD